jgi:hypothetical protein
MEPTSSEMSVIQDLISIYMRESYQPLSPEQLKTEAERMQQHLGKHAAGRMCWQSLREWQAAYATFDAYYKEKKEWEKLFPPRVRDNSAKE